MLSYYYDQVKAVAEAVRLATLKEMGNNKFQVDVAFKKVDIEAIMADILITSHTPDQVAFELCRYETIKMCAEVCEELTKPVGTEDNWNTGTLDCADALNNLLIE